jgi:sigma-B regulation protein RsbU (phosphoserine phosphatase)
MADIAVSFLHEQLLDRRQRLTSAVTWAPDERHLRQLLSDVDAALARMDQGTFGICDVCHEPVEASRLMADPLVRYCLDHLTAAERSALEYDLQAAAGLQRGLLPPAETRHDGWQVAHQYRPLGPVSGDYCDLAVDEAPERALFFFLGDVSGKGVAASMLTAQLHAIFGSLVARRLGVAPLMTEAGHIFGRSSLSPFFATLVGGRVGAGGRLEIANAGHCPPLLLRGQEVSRLEASGVPLGMFANGDYRAEQLQLDPGDVLLIYTDGLTEARDAQDEEYGEERVIDSIRRASHSSARDVVNASLAGLEQFLGGSAPSDDLTVMAIRRSN